MLPACRSLGLSRVPSLGTGAIAIISGIVFTFLDFTRYKVGLGHVITRSETAILRHVAEMIDPSGTAGEQKRNAGPWIVFTSLVSAIILIVACGAA